MGGPVLIIEDDPDIAEALRYRLEAEKFETRVALTGEDGLAASLDKHHPPAIILVDLLMPGMSGNEICRRLRREHSTQQIPIIVISAQVSAVDITLSLDAGANAYITKPFSIRDVIEHIHNLLRRRELNRHAIYSEDKRIDFVQEV